jgi:hypothetical protein
MGEECYASDSHLVGVWAIGIPGIVLFCIGIPLTGFLIMLFQRNKVRAIPIGRSLLDAAPNVWGALFKADNCIPRALQRLLAVV